MSRAKNFSQEPGRIEAGDHSLRSESRSVIPYRVMIREAGIKPVTLRPLKSEDLEDFMTWAGDPETTRSLFWDHYADPESARRFLVSVAEKHEWFMAICVGGVPVGAVTLDRGTGRARLRAELGYVVARPHWGRGVATEAVRLALARGFGELGVSRIEACVDPENIGSIRVLEKAGLAREALLRGYVVHRGKVRDRYVYARIKE